MSFTSGYPKKKAKPGPPSERVVFTRTMNNGLFVAMGSSGNLKSWHYRIGAARAKYEASMPQDDPKARGLLNEVAIASSVAITALDDLERTIRAYYAHVKQKENHGNPG